METLDKLGQIQDQGMSAIDRARMNEIQSQIATEQRGAREAILSGARQRGMGGSGMELAQQLLSQQEGANRANTEGLGIAGMAQQASTEAALQRAGLARMMQSQDFGEQERKLSAQDVINRFNVENRNQANVRNQNLRQELLGMNVQDQNRINQANVDIANQQAMTNTGFRNQQAIANTDIANQQAIANTDIANQQAMTNTGLANQATLYNTTQRPVQQFGMAQSNNQAVGQGISNFAGQSAANTAANYGANAGLLGGLMQGGSTIAGGALAGGWGRAPKPNTTGTG